MNISRPASAQSHTTEHSMTSVNTLFDSPQPPKTLSQTLISKRQPSHYQSSSLKHGSEGRKRYRRHAMQNLLDCPQRVEPTPADWNFYPGYENKTIHWDVALDIDPSMLSEMRGPNGQRSSSSIVCLPRSLRDRLKRIRVNNAFVRDIEAKVRDLIEPAAAEPDYEVVELEDDQAIDRSQHRRIRITSDAPSPDAQAYTRFWIHTIAQFYRLQSYSADIEDDRFVTVVCTMSSRLPDVWLSDMLRD